MRILTQEESVGKLLEQAQQTLTTGVNNTKNTKRKSNLQIKRRFLERELAWAEVEKRETTVKALQANLNKNQDALSKIEEKQTIINELNGQQNEQETLKKEVKQFLMNA